jgi:hypothetical protein
LLLVAGVIQAGGGGAGRADAASAVTVRVWPQVQYQTVQVHASLAATGAAGYSRLSAPESFNSNNVSSWLRGPDAAYSAAAIADVAQVNTHDYASQEGGSVYGTAQALGKPVMMSEWGPTRSTPPRATCRPGSR